MKLPASITITRPQYSDGRKCVNISVRDLVSGCEVLDAEIPYEQFVDGLMHGTGYMEADWRIDNLGKKLEVKEEVVSYSADWKDRVANAIAAVAEHEVDGWKGRAGDATNHHRSSIRDDTVRASVVFTRHVPATEEDIAAAWQRVRELRGDE